MQKMKMTRSVGFMLVIVLVSLMTIGTLVFLAPNGVGNVASAFYSDDALYSDSGDLTVVRESFDYYSREIQIYRINTSYPEFYNTNNSLSNTCANVAGVNIVGFYDRYYDNLIPDSTAGLMRPNGFVYYPMAMYTEQKQAVIDYLYTSMGTNTIQPGTSQEDFEEGLATYVTSRSRNIAYESVMTGGAIDQTKYAAQFAAGHPVALFLSGYNISTITDSDGSVTVAKNVYSGNHMMVAFGYEIFTYYDESGNVLRELTVMAVATGYTFVTGYYIVNEYSTINDAEAVIIS